MSQRYLIVSDLHLCDIEDHDDGWKDYKSSRHVFDRDFAELLRWFAQDSAPGDVQTLVLNGDIFDFDLVTAVPENPPWRVGPRERRRGLRATEEKSVWKLNRILSDHLAFVGALTDFLAAGHRIVYVLGNHDREFHFPAVQRALLEAIRASAWRRNLPTEQLAVRFEPWFYFVPGQLYVEHGNQYDYFASFRYLLAPVVRFRAREEIAHPMGDISNRYLVGYLGYFNPHCSDYILNAYSYLVHWLQHYAFSRHSMFLTWLFGSLAVISRLLRTKRRLLRRPSGHDELLEQLRQRYGLSQVQMKWLAKLQRAPITNRLYRMIREFWIDRFLIALFMIAGTIILVILSIPLWIKLVVPLCGFPLVYLLYEILAEGETVHTVEHRIPRYARTIARIMDVPVVTFGHAHVPRLLPLADEVTFVDTGTWAAMTGRRASWRRLPGYRNYLVVEFAGAAGQNHGGPASGEAEPGAPESLQTGRRGPAKMEFACWRNGAARES